MIMNRFRITLTATLLAALSATPLCAEDGLIFAKIGPCLTSSVSAEQVLGLDDVKIDVSSNVMVEGGYILEFGKHVSAGTRIAYSRLDYEYDFSDSQNPPLGEETITEDCAILMLQGVVEYRFKPDEFTPLFGLTGGFIFGGPDLDQSDFNDSPTADFMFGTFIGFGFPIAPELQGYVTFNADFPLSEDILPNLFSLQAGIAFEIE